MKWKVKDRAKMKACMGTAIVNPIEVVILRTDCEGSHPIKVTDREGNVYYCSDKDLIVDKAAANNKSVPKRSQLLPTFREIERCFRALHEVNDQCQGSTDAALVIKLAERSLFEDIKSGCRWEE